MSRCTSRSLNSRENFYGRIKLLSACALCMTSIKSFKFFFFWCRALLTGMLKSILDLTIVSISVILWDGSTLFSVFYRQCIWNLILMLYSTWFYKRACHMYIGRWLSKFRSNLCMNTIYFLLVMLMFNYINGVLHFSEKTFCHCVLWHVVNIFHNQPACGYFCEIFNFTSLEGKKSRHCM